MTIEKYGTAEWQGNLKKGKGSIATESGALKDTAYGFGKRFEGEAGSNPEELLGAAHASCFSMALSLMLEEEGLEAERIETRATVTMDPDALDITKIHLQTTARIPGAEQATFEKVAEKAKDNCPVSKLFKADITLDAKLEG